MSAEAPVGCTAPIKPAEQPAPAKSKPAEANTMTQGAKAMVQVGQKAPDFEAPAYFKGEFTKVKLSDHLGKWVVLCFYPGDFTFV